MSHLLPRGIGGFHLREGLVAQFIVGILRQYRQYEVVKRLLIPEVASGARFVPVERLQSVEDLPHMVQLGHHSASFTTAGSSFMAGAVFLRLRFFGGSTRSVITFL
ncbi:hypothetical protein SDC9_170396 [bioreactor metagenome]|uniref:Uncharacterized protein n=1 Tax=bioreactor metagenome TaxID=1076179 RepID=A0A645G7X9_9ZZZZ